MSNARSEEKHRTLSEAEMRAQMEWMNDRRIRAEIQENLDNLNKNTDRPLCASSSAAYEEKERTEEKANDTAIAASISKDLEEEETQKPKQPVKPEYTKPKGVVSLIPNTSVPHKLNFKKMSNVVISNIASYLNCKDVHRFFATTRQTHPVLEDGKSCINTTFYKAKLQATFKIANEALFKYQQDHFGERLGDYPSQFHFPSSRRDFYTTFCFRMLTYLNTHSYFFLTDNTEKLNFRLHLFALYAMLDAGNEQARYMKEALLSHFGPRILEEINMIGKQLFEEELGLMMKKQLLSELINNPEKYDCEMNKYLEGLEARTKSSLETNAKKGGCSIS